MAHIEGPSFQATLPFGWQTSEPASCASEWEILRYLPVLADFEQNQAATDLMQAKQDLALMWLARQQGLALPASTALELGMDEIAWQASSGIEVGQFGYISLVLAPTFPLLLTFAAQITRQNDGVAVAQLKSRSPALCDAWEQTIFRYHRRAIQQAKQR
jgi:hypothetical protein